MGEVVLNSFVVAVVVLTIAVYLHRVISKAVEGIVEDAVKVVIERIYELDAQDRKERRQRRIIITADPTHDETQIVPVYRE